MKKILITGGSGLIGQRITLHLEKKGHQVAWLSRSPKENKQKSFFWDIDQMKIDSEAIEWADIIIHLAGSGVADKRWTAERKQDILQSRTHSTQLIRQAIEASKKKPNSYIAASAVGYYGFDTGDKLMIETSPSGQDFLAQVVTAWETESGKIEKLGIRTVLLRIGIVLDKNGGALVEMLKPPVAAPLGNGKQWMSWIQLEDLARMFVFAAENESVEGIFNAVGPKPSTNHTLTQEAAKKVNKTFVNIGVPAFILKVMLGEMSQMVLGGNKVSPKKIEEAGFQFRYPDLESALAKTYSTGGGD
ncbi:TIGR01777 family oxidoreductase [Belliella kenyensis]|uniref:TIGR01777 family oxidoreductase n=1 Tax=Belliella kenyensis TaxID=1472724 RepID=A0ABV8EIZ0_9BACT|nr:TIGR01777 family oxidoreductase [Belliella kenyensis]MCH7403714.1 TIGR01777 family oxidoreductase [Belliella kenyensis]MDN3603481.1 TIGR01777 family oxidoreductase [Belliella kenyensis]